MGRPLFNRRLCEFTLVVLLALFGTAGIASAAGQYELKLPFAPGTVVVYGDETYSNGDDHPSIGEIAFDLIGVSVNGEVPIHAMGNGEVRHVCTHISGASVLHHRVDGYEGTISLVHLDGGSHPAWISEEWTAVQQGEYLGALFDDAIVPRNGDSCWQYSTGPHLHLDLPQALTTIDGSDWSTLSPNDFARLTSTNVLVDRSTTTTTTTTAAPPTTTTTAAPTTTTTAAPATTSTAAPTTTTSTTTTAAPTTTTTTTAAPTTTTTLPPRVLSEPALQCGGLDVTIAGTAGDDELIGTPGPDVISGLQGDDTIYGLGGDDVICGGIGDDELIGGFGFDILYGAQGNDALFGARSSSSGGLWEDTKGNRMFGGAGNDQMYGSSKWDRMQGGRGQDVMFGFRGRDWMRGGADGDYVSGGPNGDNIHGGNGPDEMIVTAGDTVRGGASRFDICDVRAGTPLLIRSCERVRR